jgi:hypothetical protein
MKAAAVLDAEPSTWQLGLAAQWMTIRLMVRDTIFPHAGHEANRRESQEEGRSGRGLMSGLVNPISMSSNC